MLLEKQNEESLKAAGEVTLSRSCFLLSQNDHDVRVRVAGQRARHEGRDRNAQGIFYRVGDFRVAAVVQGREARGNASVIQPFLRYHVRYASLSTATQSVTNLKNPAHLRKLTFLNNTFSDSTNPYLASYLDPPFSTDVDSLPERIYSNTEKVQITQLITYGGKYQTHSRKWASGGKTWSEPIWKVDGGKVEYYDTGCGGEGINNCINGGFGWIKGNWGEGGRDVGRGLEMFKIGECFFVLGGERTTIYSNATHTHTHALHSLSLR